MIRQEIRDELKELGFETSLLFDNPSFDDSVVGYTEDGRVVYNYDYMIEEFATDNGCSHQEAEEFIEYNTIRALPYAQKEVAPIIVYPLLSCKYCGG